MHIRPTINLAVYHNYLGHKVIPAYITGFALSGLLTMGVIDFLHLHTFSFPHTLPYINNAASIRLQLRFASYARNGKTKPLRLSVYSAPSPVYFS